LMYIGEYKWVEIDKKVFYIYNLAHESFATRLGAQA